MSGLQDFWRALPRGKQMGLLAGVLFIAASLALAIGWLMRTDYQVLFNELKPQDAQAMTAELDRLKIPYRVGDDGSSILVDKAQVPATRIKLMSKDLPLRGAVGLELFNNTDFGMTEFAQKINYQRALQGELTRTIGALAEVRDVRVLLALPEQGLFKQASAKATASITLSLQSGRILRSDQVLGIQRLVAAAVPGMSAQDVTIVDSQGVALTRLTQTDANGETASAARLELKRETEAYLAHKVQAVLERAMGAGQTLASVDVTLNMDQVRTTTEDVVPAVARAGLPATGVVVREREALRDGGALADKKVLDSIGAARGGNTQRETEYAVSRRVEQVVNQPGSIRRIHVVAVVRQALDAPHEEQLRSVLAAAAGAQPDRGDTVVIQSLSAQALSASPSSSPLPSAQDLPAAAGLAVNGHAGDGVRSASHGGWWRLAAAGAVAFVLLALVLLAVVIGLRRARDAEEPARTLSPAERMAALRQIQDWMAATPGQERTAS